jgi:hypothetical protein
VLRKQIEYDEAVWLKREADRQKNLEAKLKRQAKRLGYELVQIAPAAS